jgi:hypothetical protein
MRGENKPNPSPAVVGQRGAGEMPSARSAYLGEGRVGVELGEGEERRVGGGLEHQRGQMRRGVGQRSCLRRELLDQLRLPPLRVHPSGCRRRVQWWLGLGFEVSARLSPLRAFRMLNVAAQVAAYPTGVARPDLMTWRRSTRRLRTEPCSSIFFLPWKASCRCQMRVFVSV